MVYEVNGKFEAFPQVKAIRALLGANVDIAGSILEQFGAKENAGVDIDIDVIIENQRGMKFFGIPMFSSKSLIPGLDPPTFQSMSGDYVLNAKEFSADAVNNLLVNNYPLPDLNWEWAWETWYVLMLNDVDDQGWIYSHLWFKSHHWKGKYYFGNFVRRRIWARLRNKKGYQVNSLYRDKSMKPDLNCISHDSNVTEYGDGEFITVGSADQDENCKSTSKTDKLFSYVHGEKKN